ncbi:MAG: hypothetical protein JXX29_10060 [Deltaproteobacteria bacterium]|nr:hypothetical protein [Deltaproteobacteria bacterium]MBN2672009.1 hypothetical protein [Deltaproteobacteria bacterium]
MAIDFEEKEGPKTTLATCSQHGLRYDPANTWGCVLCRTNQKKRISGYVVTAVVLLVAGGIYYLLPIIHPKDEPQMSAMVSVGDSGDDDSESVEASAYECRLNLSKEVEKCIAKIDPSGTNVRMDKEFCLNVLKDPQTQCGDDFIPQDYLKEPLYKVSQMPDWTAVRAVMEQSQVQIEECVGGRSYRFSARVMINSQNGHVDDVTLSLFGLNTTQRFCLYKYFESLIFPVQSVSQYTFVTRIDSELLAKNRPEETDEHSEEFKKFVEQKRNAKLEESKRAEIMKQRSEFDKRFQTGVNPEDAPAPAEENE